MPNTLDAAPHTLEPSALPEPLSEDSAESSTEAAPNSTILSGAARGQALALLASIFVIAACGLIYELLIATVSSYLLGSSVTQFSISIGVFIGAMGLGSHLSQRVTRRVPGIFILEEVEIGVVGGLSVWTLFAPYAAGTVDWRELYTSQAAFVPVH